MLSGTLVQIAIAFFAMACIGGLAWVFLMPRLDGTTATAKRVEKISTRTSPLAAGPDREKDGVKRRRQVEDTIREIEERNKKTRKRNLKTDLRSAGLRWSVQKFWIISLLIGQGAAAAALFSGASPLAAGAAFFIFTLGFPRWLLKFLRNRRERAFLNEFANAVDVIVRGVKAGLPLLDCLRIVSQESSEPVRSEFRAVIEAQVMGIPVAEAVARMYERTPLAEVSFFVIVITIQQKTGGNLSETLLNLSRVLRDRKKMKAKITAMSQEAKASAMIIGALPLVVMGLVSMTSPDYIALLWTDKLGQLMLLCSAFWMFCGVMVMRKMINFDF